MALQCNCNLEFRLKKNSNAIKLIFSIKDLGSIIILRLV